MTLMTVQGLTKSFGGNKVVDDLSFSIGKGRCMALLGPNGAGKTTTLRMLTGLLAPTAGSVRLQGLAPQADRRGWIGYLPQIPSFYAWMSGEEYVQYSGRLCGMSAKEAKGRTKALLERVGLADAAKRRIGGYSGGMKQRLGMAQALIHRPKLIILDEPVSALDPIGRREVMTLLRELKQETTILFSTHVLHDAEELCDDVLIMHGGRAAVCGDMATVRREHQQPILHLETSGDPRSLAWLQGLKAQGMNPGHPFIKEAEMTARGLRIIVKDMNHARKALVKQIAEQDIQVTRLEIGQTTLEDLFLKVVGV